VNGLSPGFSFVSFNQLCFSRVRWQSKPANVARTRHRCETTAYGGRPQPKARLSNSGSGFGERNHHSLMRQHRYWRHFACDSAVGSVGPQVADRGNRVWTYRRDEPTQAQVPTNQPTEPVQAQVPNNQPTHTSERVRHFGRDLTTRSRATGSKLCNLSLNPLEVHSLNTTTVVNLQAISRLLKAAHDARKTTLLLYIEK
jgi:hypothetical protein